MPSHVDGRLPYCCWVDGWSSLPDTLVVPAGDNHREHKFDDTNPPPPPPKWCYRALSADKLHLLARGQSFRQLPQQHIPELWWVGYICTGRKHHPHASPVSFSPPTLFSYRVDPEIRKKKTNSISTTH